MDETTSKKTEFPTDSLKLKAADILLIHTKKSLWGWIIRRGTHCYWNHALIVYSPGSPKKDYGDTLVIDAKTGGTIEMDRLRKYLDRRDKYEVAVKRLEADWFQDNRQLLETGFRNYVCNIAAGEVVVNYNSKLSCLIKQTIRQATIILRFLKHKIFRSKKSPRLPWNIRPIQIKAFTCGGFVQWCYYKGISQLIKEHGLDKSTPKNVIFNPRAKKRTTPYELLTTTPADLANCNDLSWKYIIKGGYIREVSDYKEMAFYYGVA